MRPARDESAASRPAAQAGPGARGAEWTWTLRRRLAATGLTVAALLPVLYVLQRTAAARLNLVYWDEFDTVLAFLLRMKEGMSPGAFLHDLFVVNNEHRMVTSRLIFATSYWLTGTVNFAVLDWIGISWIFGTCGLLLAAAGSGLRRLRLGLLLGFLFFQLEHWENFLWSGSSIDHFQLVMLAVGSVIAIARGTWAGVLAGAFLALLATFTLAHGLLLWPVGALMLWRSAPPRRLLAWCGLAAAAIGAYAIGFRLNEAQDFAAFSWAGVGRILHYWLSILGAVPALGHQGFAPVLGVSLLGLVALTLARGAWNRERVASPLVLFALAATALIALGRAEDSGGEIYSRYYVLSALAWALTLFVLLERPAPPQAPLRPLFLALPALAVFNVAADRQFNAKVEAWLEARERAVTRFQQSGADGTGPFTLHPNPPHATEILRRAEAAGVYRLGPVSLPRTFPPNAVESSRIAYVIDEATVNPRSAFLRGWVAVPGHRSGRGEIHVILRSNTERLLFTTVTITRPDVAEGTKQPGWRQAGFRFVRRRDRLPTGEYQIGFLLMIGGKSEYVMTPHRLSLVGEGKALLATGN